MCTADIGLIPQFWYGREGKAVLDLESLHTCRPFNPLKEFMAGHPGQFSYPTVLPKDGDFVLWNYTDF